MNDKRTRRSNTDELNEARAEITRLRAENERLLRAIADATAANGLIHTIVQDLVRRLETMLPKL